MVRTILALLVAAMDIIGEIMGLSQQEEEEGREREHLISNILEHGRCTCVTTIALSSSLVNSGTDLL